ncbi:4-hydroxybenzoate octaprenyltransferase [Marinicella litoralis]|uniref:4-hydroxybenzoate octaprenyltransferase n=1 Tax=Marinicella litoralis TaxID=644220 RepID=A0A4R6XG52_9GAMM|nr:4-hydroxybenzoate octaprenyltransferase [Marinicella litoralis]TDR18352.1 4-hydroxybenzoate polyprenyltransferase [Marinicella litoralis]
MISKSFLSIIKPYLLLMRMDRPIGTLLLLWPTWWALWSASNGHPDFNTWLIFTLGVFIMRAAGCVVNDISDRKYDGHVGRTQNRPLAKNTLPVRHAWYLFFGLLLSAAVLLLFLKQLTIIYALIAAFFAVTYPLMKRVTYLPQVYLGIAFSFSIPMAYAEITGSVPKVAWLLFVTNILWTTSYDTIYAMIDRKDDLKIGVKSTAILFGDLDRIIIGIIQLLTVLALYLFGNQLEYSATYYLAVIAVIWLFVYQQLLILNRDENKCFKAFIHNNWVGMVVFLGIFSHFVMKSSFST